VAGRRTALVVLVPEAEAVVGRLRDELDPAARLGVPAHVTVLYPFVPASEVVDDVVARTAALYRSVPRFRHDLVRTGWFGDEVLWLAPDAGEDFRSLTGRVWAAFPDHPPYEGRFDDVVPHLTVADHGPVGTMRAAERALRDRLPISAVARAVTLLVEQTSGRWSPAMSFPLAAPRPDAVPGG
jgi:2'-5' RNA ligase